MIYTIAVKIENDNYFASELEATNVRYSDLDNVYEFVDENSKVIFRLAREKMTFIQNGPRKLGQ